MVSFFDKLKKSLSRTKEAIAEKIYRVVTGRKIDQQLIDELEEILIEADVGVQATQRLIDRVGLAAREQKLTEGDQIIGLLKDEIASILSRTIKTATPPAAGLTVWLITGVNGVGKTTTIGKLATYLVGQQKKVMIAACDTFRAAAIDQISIWAERSGVEIIRSQEGADPASVAHDAAAAAKARGTDILLIDTAGRLHTKAHLMEELKKIRRVVQRAAPDATILSKLIIDGNTGQNAISQARVFTEAVGCDGIIVTKLDGTAKGGVVIAVSEELGAPVEFIGLGESIDDLQPFDPKSFAEALFAR
jgi:fused signal recognition particle receptor